MPRKFRHIKRQIFHNRSSHSDLCLYSKWTRKMKSLATLLFLSTLVSFGHQFSEDFCKIAFKVQKRFCAMESFKVSCQQIFAKECVTSKLRLQQILAVCNKCFFPEPESSLCPHDSFVENHLGGYNILEKFKSNVFGK